MSDLQSRFEQAVRDIESLPERPDNPTLLRLYASYKQSSQGDSSAPKPGFFDFVGTTKYEAWVALSGMPQDDARQQYIDLSKTLTGRPPK